MTEVERKYYRDINTIATSLKNINTSLRKLVEAVNKVNDISKTEKEDETC